MAFVVDVLHQEGVQASVVSIDKEEWDGTAWDARENLLLIKLFENFDENLSGDATTQEVLVRQLIVLPFKVHCVPPG